MRHRAWGWLVLVPVTMSMLVMALAPFRSFHQHLALAGTPDRFAATVVRAGRSDARAALWLDNLFVLSWVVIVPRLLRAGLERWAPERRRMVSRWMVAPTVALFAGAGDLVQNVLALTMVGKRQPATGLTLALASVTWITWLLFVWSIVAVLVLVVGPLIAPGVAARDASAVRPARRPRRHAPRTRPGWRRRPRRHRATAPRSACACRAAGSVRRASPSVPSAGSMPREPTARRCSCAADGWWPSPAGRTPPAGGG